MSLLTRYQKTNSPTLQSRLPMLNDLDHFIDDAINRMGFSEYGFNSDKMVWQPRVNVSESDKEYKVSAEIPGMNEKDIELTMQDNTLYVRGEKKFEKTEEGEDYHRVESSYGYFHRAIPLSNNIDEDKVSAEYKNGVLLVKLGKSDEAVNNTHKIKINKQ